MRACFGLPVKQGILLLWRKVYNKTSPLSVFFCEKECQYCTFMIFIHIGSTVYEDRSLLHCTWGLKSETMCLSSSPPHLSHPEWQREKHNRSSFSRECAVLISSQGWYASVVSHKSEWPHIYSQFKNLAKGALHSAQGNPHLSHFPARSSAGEIG